MRSTELLKGTMLPVLLLVWSKGAQLHSTGSSRPSFASPEKPVNLAGNFYLERSQDSFGIRSHGIIERMNSRSNFYPLPQGSFEAYKRLRAKDLDYMWPVLTENTYEHQEVIGPYQIVDGQVWFGNDYYDGEGERGVGAFGYFDMKTRRYVMFTPPEISRWETSAILVEPATIWLALDHFGEDVSTSPGGLIRWNREDHSIRRYSLEFVVGQIRRHTNDPAMLFLKTSGGYALFREGAVKRFRVENLADGRTTAIPVNRFPAQPSIY